jgi:YesN/AraC family two-component response regulator
VMMPFKDGFEVCKTLKNDERTSHIPIIMLTAKADIDSKLQGLEQGADVYLMKPFHKEELLLRIKKLLELRQQLQQFYRSNAVYTEGSLTQPIEKPNPLTNNADNVFVIKVRTLIEANLANTNFDVEKLSHDLLLSPSQVHRKLTALTGLSTNSFIRYIRLSSAKNLLITNAHFSIAAIAYDSGFSDPAYFSRAFKQEFGETPQAWREQNLGKILRGLKS